MLHEDRLPFHPAKPTCLHTYADYSLLRVAVGGRIVTENRFSLLSHPSLLMNSLIPGLFEDGEVMAPEVLLKDRAQVEEIRRNSSRNGKDGGDEEKGQDIGQSRNQGNGSLVTKPALQQS
ncbi:unnamed protein product [Bubo scandiacus]